MVVTIQFHILIVALSVTVTEEGVVQRPPADAVHIEVVHQLEVSGLALLQAILHGAQVFHLGNLIGVGLSASALRVEQSSSKGAMVHIKLNHILTSR